MTEPADYCFLPHAVTNLSSSQLCYCSHPVSRECDKHGTSLSWHRRPSGLSSPAGWTASHGSTPLLSVEQIYPVILALHQ